MAEREDELGKQAGRKCRTQELSAGAVHVWSSEVLGLRAGPGKNVLASVCMCVPCCLAPAHAHQLEQQQAPSLSL